MVYPGHPSTGCLQCIKRRVKCDELKPQCQRCIKRGLQCPGYERPKFRFVEANKNSRPTHGTSSRSASEVASDDNVGSPATDVSVSPSTVSRDWTNEAIHWYFQSYVIPGSGTFEIGWFDFLPQVFGSVSGSPLVGLSVQAVSLAGYANYLHADNLSLNAQAAYGSALTALNSSLRNEALARRDETLLSALLLVLFETINGVNSPLQSHIEGLLTILKLRGPNQFSYRYGRSLFRLVQMHLPMKALMRAQTHNAASIESEINATAVRAMSGLDRECARVLDRVLLTFRIAGLSADAIQRCRIGDTQTPAAAQVAFLLEESTAVDEALQRLLSQVWPMVSEARGLQPNSSARATAQQDIMTLLLHNMYRCSRIRLHEVRLRCMQALIAQEATLDRGGTENEVFNPDAWNSSQIIRQLGQEICASVPECLGDVNQQIEAQQNRRNAGHFAAAYLLMSPLLVTRLATHTTQEQQNFATRTLERIGLVFGIKQALTMLHDRGDLFEI